MFDEDRSLKKEEFVWTFKYAPKTKDDIIVLDRMKPLLEKMILSKSVPDLLLYGPAGTGKTSFINVLINEIGFSVLRINGSRDTSVEIVRNDIKKFTRRATDKPKLVFIDEMERLSPNAQDSLKAEIEDCQKTVFVFTSNHAEKIIDPIKSRCGGGISFYFNNDEKKELQKKYYQRCIKILDDESVEYEKKGVAKVVQTFFPDMRNIIHNLQLIFNQHEKITYDNVASSIDTDLKEFFILIKDGNFDKIRSYCINLNSSYELFYGNVIRKVEKYVESDSIPEMIDLCYEHNKATIGNADPMIPMIHFCFSIIDLNLK